MQLTFKIYTIYIYLLRQTDVTSSLRPEWNGLANVWDGTRYRWKSMWKMLETRVIYENFTKRRAKVMIFDSGKNDTESGFCQDKTHMKKKNQRKNGNKNMNSKTKRWKPRAAINKQTHSIIFERILIYHRWWRTHRDMEKQRERKREWMKMWNENTSIFRCWNDFVGTTMWLNGGKNNCSALTAAKNVFVA